jgi:hypothetical protein
MMKLDNHRTLQHRIHELFLSKIAVTLNYRLLWVVRASRKKIAIAKNREKIAKKSRKNREKIAKKSRKKREKIAKNGDRSTERTLTTKSYFKPLMFKRSHDSPMYVDSQSS